MAISRKEDIYKALRRTAAVFAAVLVFMSPAMPLAAESDQEAQTVDFGTVEEGFAVSEPAVITAAGLTRESVIKQAPKYFTAEILAGDGTVTLTVVPDRDLAEGVYEEILTVTERGRAVYSAVLRVEIVPPQWPKMIKNLNIIVQEPEAGYVCSSYCTAELPWYTGGSDAKADWRCADDGRDMVPGKDVFEAGKTYQVVVGPFREDDYYYFRDAFVATINGMHADISMNSGTRVCILTCAYSPLETQKAQITAVDLSVGEVTGGDTASDLEVTAAPDRGYTVEPGAGDIPFITYAATGDEILPEEELRTGNVYKVTVTVLPDNEFMAFSEDTVCTVGGKRALTESASADRCVVSFTVVPSKAPEEEGDSAGPGTRLTQLIVLAFVLLAAAAAVLIYMSRD